MNNVIFTKRNFIFFISTILLLGLFYFECFIDVDKDIDAFIGASKLIASGESCYNTWIPSGGDFLLYYYSPLFALLLSPLTFLPQTFVNIIWLSFNLFFLYRIFRLIEFYLPISTLSSRNRNFYFLLLALSIFRFLLYNFDLGQMTIFLVFASLESIRLILEDKKTLGAALLALAINIKLLPITLLAYLIYRGEFRASILTVLFFVLYLFLPAIFIGMDFNTSLIVEWWNLLTNTIDNSLADDSGRPSLSSFIPSLLMEINGKLDIRRNILSLNVETAILILNIVRGLLVLLTLYFLKSLPFRKVKDLVQNYYALAYILLIIPLIFPHQGKYSFFYMLPAFSYSIYMVFCLFKKKKETVDYKVPIPFKLAISSLIASFVLTTLTTDGIIGRHYSDVADHFHLITIGALVLIIPLAIFRPETK